MFTKAGFDRRCVPICRAWIGHRGAGWVRASTLVRFKKSGEYAWWGRGGISWPEHVTVYTLREVMPSDLKKSGPRRPSSLLSARPEHVEEQTA